MSTPQVFYTDLAVVGLTKLWDKDSHDLVGTREARDAELSAFASAISLASKFEKGAQEI